MWLVLFLGLFHRGFGGLVNTNKHKPQLALRTEPNATTLEEKVSGLKETSMCHHLRKWEIGFSESVGFDSWSINEPDKRIFALPMSEPQIYHYMHKYNFCPSQSHDNMNYGHLLMTLVQVFWYESNRQERKIRATSGFMNMYVTCMWRST